MDRIGQVEEEVLDDEPAVLDALPDESDELDDEPEDEAALDDDPEPLLEELEEDVFASLVRLSLR